MAIFSIIACKNKTENSFTSLDETLKGAPSPKFTNYENYDGSTTSLDNLKGKYVYLDVWATWCGPCRDEIPHLKKIEEEFRGQNIEFVSISVDDLEAKEAWRNMVAKEEMKGIQLFANGDKEILDGYKVNSIPRFILIDDKGNVLDYDTYSPSDPLLRESLNALLN